MGNPSEAELSIPPETQWVWRAWSVPLGVFLLPVLQGRASQGWSRISWLPRMEFPVPLVPSSLGPSGLRVQVMKAPPKSCSMLPSCLMLGILGVHGAAEAVGAHRSVSFHGYSSTHTWVLRGAWEGGTGSTRSWVFISRVKSKSSKGRFLGDGSGMFHAVALPTWALMWGLVIPLCQVLHTGMGGKGRGGGSWAQ